MPEPERAGGTGSRYEFEPLLDSVEAGKLLHLCPESVKRLARCGKLAAAKMGGVWRFRASALEAYMQELMDDTRSRTRETMAPSDTVVGVTRNRSR